MENKATCPHCAKQKHTPRSEEEIKNLKMRINKIIGQLNGVTKMIDENRYCGDILNLVAATESALQQVGYIILKSHMESCVYDDIRQGNKDSLEESFELIKRLK